MRHSTFWEYSFRLHTLNLGEAVRMGTNPFTGEAVAFHIDEGLSIEQISAVHQVFNRHGINGPEPEFEGYAKYGVDGQSLRLRGSDLDGNGPVTDLSVEIVVMELSDDVLAIVLDIARAGGFAVTHAIGEQRVCIVDRSSDAKVLSRWPDARMISSVVELRRWVEDVVGRREVRRYRD